MAKIFEQESRTFSEYLLVPNLTTEKNTPDQVDLSAPIAKYRKGQEESRFLQSCRPFPMTVWQ